MRINRNIVECKVCRYSSRICRSLRINRNIVECKDSPGFELGQDTRVLIETLWNVKKDTSLGASADEIGINRNIVECKAVDEAEILCKLKY